jgi:hypothetical protein
MKIAGRMMRAIAAVGLSLGALFAAPNAQAALIGLTAGEPTIDFAASGIIKYVASTGLVTISGTPSVLFQSNPFIFGQIIGESSDNERLITIVFKVDSNGNYIAGNGTTDPDLLVKGAVDVNSDGVVDFDGTLLTANVTQFGFQPGTAGVASSFDIRLTSVGGLLQPTLYPSTDLAIVVFSEQSAEFPNPFAGSFTANFTGQARGTLGTTAALPHLCKIEADAYCSVNGSANATKCRIQQTRSEKHWDWEDRSASGVANGKPYTRYSYGMHGDPVPSWPSHQPATPVTFNYVVTNTGTTPITNLHVDDSFDSPPTAVPTTLAPGQSVTLTRTEQLREGLENVLMATGTYSTDRCADRSTVVIKDKLRARRRHDYDDYSDKGEGETGQYK